MYDTYNSKRCRYVRNCYHYDRAVHISVAVDMRTLLDRNTFSSITNGQVAARRVTGLIIKRLWYCSNQIHAVYRIRVPTGCMYDWRSLRLPGSESGECYTFGSNHFGQLGYSTEQQCERLVRRVDIPPATHVACGDTFTVAVTTGQISGHRREATMS